jgi:hypothetical protein
MKQTETIYHRGACVRLEGVVHKPAYHRPVGQPLSEQGEFHRAVVERGSLPSAIVPDLFDDVLGEGDEVSLDILGIDEDEAIRRLVHRRDVTDHHMEEADLGLL